MITFQIIKQVLLEIWSRLLNLFKTIPEETPATITQPLQVDSSVPERITPEDLRMAVELGKLAVQKRRQINEDFAKESAEIAAEILARKSLERASEAGRVSSFYYIKSIFHHDSFINYPQKPVCSRIKEIHKILNDNTVFWETLRDLLRDVYCLKNHTQGPMGDRCFISIDDLIEPKEETNA